MLQKLLTRESVLIFLGLAFFWPVTQSYPYHTLIYQFAETGSFTTGLFYTFYPLILVLIFIGLLFARGDFQRQLLSSLPLKAVLGGAGVLGFIMALIAPYTTELSVVFTAMGLLLGGLYTAFYLVVWGKTCLKGDMATIAVRIVLSFILYQIVMVIFVAIGLNQSFILPIGAVVSTLCLCFAQHYAEPELPAEGPADGHADTADNDAQEIPMHSRLRRIPWTFVILSIVLLYFDTFFIKILFSQTGEVADPYRLVSSAVSIAVMAALAIFFCWRGRRSAVRAGKLFSDNDLSITFTVLLVVYMAALLIVLLEPEGVADFDKRIWSACGSNFRIFLWLLACYISLRDRHLTFIAFGGYGIFAMAIPFTISLNLGASEGGVFGTLASYANTSIIGEVALFVIAAVAVILTLIRSSGAAAALRREASANLSAENGAPSRTSDAALNKRLNDLGLSDREAQVVTLMCHGYSAKRTADTLGLSENTVNSHIARVYRKLAIHSKQELIDLIEQTEE